MAARPVQLLLSSHPGPVAGVTLASAGYAGVLGRGAGGTAAVAVAVLAGQLSVGWHNDWLDAERDIKAGRADKPVARGVVTRDSVKWAALLAAGAAVPLSLLSGWRAALAHLGAVACAWGYNAGIKATLFSFAPYAIAFGLLPVFISLGARGAPLGPWWAPVAAALLGVGAHLMNALPDLEDDAAAGVRGLPHRLGRRRSLAAAAVLLLTASVVLAFHAGTAPAAGIVGLVVTGCCVALALLSARRTTSRAPFGLTIAAALVDVMLLLLAGHGMR
ncbi:MAG: 4-hydroxybenzoate polyprenyltransferase-like prenyltransferase [Acidimicrobiaceae bacterium]|nr:4-hydroxybenzoate polyprenyltransferase-like prenyltransferase [Acidimicrobiaceae bacterium]